MARKKSDAPDDQTTPAGDDVVDTILADNPDIADEMQFLTRGEKIIRLRQRGLIVSEVE